VRWLRYGFVATGSEQEQDENEDQGGQRECSIILHFFGFKKGI